MAVVLAYQEDNDDCKDSYLTMCTDYKNGVSSLADHDPGKVDIYFLDAASFAFL